MGRDGDRAPGMPESCACDRPIGECVKGDGECPLAMYGDDENEYEVDDIEDDFDCGLMSNGQCTKAGSEECDWSCPNRESELFAGSAANLAKQK